MRSEGGPRGARSSLEVSGQRQGHPHAPSSQFPPKHQPRLLRPRPAPTPRLPQPPRTLVKRSRGRSGACAGPSGEGAPAGPLQALSLFPTAAWPPLPFPYTVTVAGGGCWGTLTCSGRRSAAGDPGCSPRVPTCYILQGKREGTRRKKNRASFAASRWGMT